MSERKGLLGGLKLDWYLVLIVTMAVIAAIAPARGDGAVIFGWITKVAIALVFFLHGARLSREAVIGGLGHWRLHLVVLASTYVMFPLLTLGVVALPAWITPPELAAGIIFLGCLPSTIQSSIAFVSIAKGNVAAAVASASASNLLGVALTPLLVGLLMQAHTPVTAEAVWKIVFQLLIPFAAGQLLRPVIGRFVAAHARRVGQLDKGAILLVVYTAFSGAVIEGVWTRVSVFDLARLVAICAVLLAVVLGLTLVAARTLRFSHPDEIAIVFCGSKKSLASGAPMAAAIFPTATAGVALLPLMIFHQIQLMACAAIARRYGKEPDTAAASG